MHKFWLTVAAFCMLAPIVGGVAQGAETPSVTPQDHVLGKADAAITIIEYASLTCPHCAAFDRDTLPKIRENWIDTGKAKLVFRIFPLNKVDVRAAVVANCVAPERFFTFIDELYRNQDTWIRAADPEKAVANIGRLAGAGGDKITGCLADKGMENDVIKVGYAAQQNYGVESTPTFFINGTKLVGEASYADFEKALIAAQPKT
jgi:protein-disulfide isomerase